MVKRNARSATKRPAAAAVPNHQEATPDPATLIAAPAAFRSLMQRLQQRSVHVFVALFVLLSALFVRLPVTQVTDGQFSLLLAHAMVFDHTTRLDPYLDPKDFHAQEGFFYWYWQLSPEKKGAVQAAGSGDWNGTDALYYRYPTLPAVLSIPGVWLAQQLGLSVVDERGFYDHRAEHLLHRFIAAVVAAFTVALIFRLALLALPLPWALAVALVSGLGTQIISTLSRGVWSDTWALPIALLAVHHLLAHALGKTPQQALRPIYLAIISALAFFCKPNYAVVGMTAFAYVLTTASRKQLISLTLVGSALALGFIGFSLWQFGTFIPDYYRPALQWQYLPPAFSGHLFSPSRGLFIYCPFLIMVLATLWQHRAVLCAPKLARLMWLPIGVLMLVSSAWGTWWGGHSYGPRLIIPLLPWTILLTILAVEAYGRQAGRMSAKPLPFALWRKQPSLNPKAFTWQGVQQKPVALTLWLISAALAVAINVHGAHEPKTWLEWFYRPYPVFQNPEKRVWDWSDAQWLAGIVPRAYERGGIIENY